MRPLRILIAASALALAAALLPAPTPAAPAPQPAPHPPRVRVGDVVLTPCGVVTGALCGSIERAWEPGRPQAGKVTVGFAFRPATDTSQPAVGTLVPHEGGPGYSTTGTGSDFAAMYGPLLDRRNLLLVDQRGTGRSEPINCPALQNLTIRYADAAGQCGAQLGDRADDYSSALSADDLAAVIEALHLDGAGGVDVYGDSYGTFFAQVFVGRHPDLVRSLVVDGAYPTYGETAWYPTQAPAMRRAFDLVCERSDPCRTAGAPFLTELNAVLAQVRTKPWKGTAYDADGRQMQVTVDGSTLTTVAFGATYTPAFYREFTAALRTAIDGDRAPLLRLVAEATGGDTDAGPAKAYSEGLDAAVACHDYPQLYDMTAAPQVRRQQYAAALAARQAGQPNTYGPFTVAEYAASDWQYLDWCTDWPAAPASNPAGPPTPPSGSYPNVPVLVLSGDLDTITTAAEGTLVKEQFPNARQVIVRNSFHVTALGDTDGCAELILRDFVTTPAAALTRACSQEVEPVRALGTFPTSIADVEPATGGTAAAGRVARATALTIADVPDRWWNNYVGAGVGLRGGTFTFTGSRRVSFDLDEVKLVQGLTVSGTALWNRNSEKMTIDVTVTAKSGLPSGHLTGTWDTRAVGAQAVLTGTLGGRAVTLTLPAP